MKAARYYIRQYSGHVYEHGGVGYTDLEKILDDHGYKPLLLPEKDPHGLLNHLARAKALISHLSAVKAGSTVVFIHPVFARMYRLMVRLLSARKIRVICILADIDGIKDGDEALLKRELNFLRAAPAFIVHNKAMQDWLQQRFPGVRTATLEFFDFLATPATVNRQKSNAIVFAGNLAKSGFLRKLNEEGLRLLHFNLYGPGLPPPIAGYANSTYKGSFAPVQLPALLEGSFGLVWDGDGIAEPEGSLGHYMSIISQHKLSLYILSGLPVIIHSSAACGSLVETAGIGFMVDDLRLIPEKIKALPEESYNLMRKNMEPLALKLSTGANLLQALEELYR